MNALLDTAQSYSVPLSILKSAVEVNQTQPFYILERMELVVGGMGKRLLCLDYPLKLIQMT